MEEEVERKSADLSAIDTADVDDYDLDDDVEEVVHYWFIMAFCCSPHYLGVGLGKGEKTTYIKDCMAHVPVLWVMEIAA